MTTAFDTDTVLSLEAEIGVPSTPEAILETWPQVKIDRTIEYLEKIKRDRAALPKERARYLAAVALAQEESMELRDASVWDVAPSGTIESLIRATDSIISLLASTTESSREDLTAEVFKRAKKVPGVPLHAGIYLTPRGLVRVTLSPVGRLYAEYPTTDGWEYVRDGMASVITEGRLATIADLDTYAKETGKCFICGEKTTEPMRSHACVKGALETNTIKRR